MLSDNIQDVMDTYINLCIHESDLVYSEPEYVPDNAQPWLDWFSALWKTETERKAMFRRYTELVEAL